MHGRMTQGSDLTSRNDNMFQPRRSGLAVFVLLISLLAGNGYTDDRRDASGLARHGETFRVVAPDYPWTQVTREADDATEFKPPLKSITRRIPGEFEKQRALLLACRDLVDDFPDLLTEIVRATHEKVELILLVSDLEQSEQVTQLLEENSVPANHIRFAQLPHDTMWARDYGPIIVRSREGKPVVIDPDYDVDRAQDDRVPSELGRLLNLEVDPLPLRIDGGNLLSNGAGLVITTSRLFDENVFGEVDESTMRTVLRERCGIEQICVLEPLAGEPTGHADMFATFVSSNVVVVGRFDPNVDPLNAEILDRNAIALSKTKIGDKWLHVVRMDMPPHDDGIWRTHTNVIFANGVLMMPTYGDADLGIRDLARQTYSRLLPRWKIVAVDASEVIQSEGALHCMTMNLGPLGRLPEFPRPQPRVEEALDIFDDTTLAVEVDAESDVAVPDIFREDAPQHLEPEWSRAAARRSARMLHDAVHLRSLQRAASKQRPLKLAR